MIKKYNQQKKAIALPDRNTGQKSNWGIVWNKSGYEFCLIPTTLQDIAKPDIDTAVVEMSNFLQDSIKAVDRINEYFNITYMPGEQTHIQEIRVREPRTTVSSSRLPLFDEIWFVITEVDREFCVIENVVTGETQLEMKGKLFGVKPDEMSNLALHWTECHVIANDRLRRVIDQLRQSKKVGNLGEGSTGDDETGTDE